MKKEKETNKTWVIEIQIPADRVRMIFTNQSLAQQEYEKIRRAGIYAAQWIQTITLYEH